MNIVIVNPVAGNGKSKKIFEKVKYSSYFREETHFYISEYEGHIQEIIRDLEATTKITLLFIIGGDGTVNKVVDALSDKSIPIAYIPGGSGNDFARGFSSLKEPEEIIRRAIEKKKKAKYWLASYELEENPLRTFINCLGFGFDAVVTNSARNLSFRDVLSKFKLDSLIYLFALIRELFAYKPLEMTVTFDGVERTFHNVLFLTVNNQPYMGGGMKINPSAENNAKELSIIVIDSVPKWKIFLLFGTVFIGVHTLFKDVQIYKAKEVTVRANRLLPYQVDGEYGETSSAKIRKVKEPIYLKGTK